MGRRKQVFDVRARDVCLVPRNVPKRTVEQAISQNQQIGIWQVVGGDLKNRRPNVACLIGHNAGFDDRCHYVTAEVTDLRICLDEVTHPLEVAAGHIGRGFNSVTFKQLGERLTSLFSRCSIRSGAGVPFRVSP